MSHTPTPWHTEKLPHIERGHEDVPRFRLWSGKTPVIDGFILDEQDAAFIVKAANSHDRLVEALRKLANEVCALRAFEGELRAELGNTNYNILMQRTDEARAALEGL